MIGFKAFDKYLQCRGFQYEIGAIYDLEKKPIICEQGYHFCDKIEKVYDYYPRNEDTRICIVESLGEIDAIDNKGTRLRKGLFDDIDVDFDSDNADKYCTNKIKIIAEIKNPLDIIKPCFFRRKDKSSLPDTIAKVFPAPKVGDTMHFNIKEDLDLDLICISKQKGKYIFSFNKCLGCSDIYKINEFLDNIVGNEKYLPKEYWDVIEEVFIPSEYEVFGNWSFGNPDIEPWEPLKYYKFADQRIKFENWWLRSSIGTLYFNTNYCYVNKSGINNYDYNTAHYGVAPCFVIDEKYFEESGQNDENDYIEF